MSRLFTDLRNLKIVLEFWKQNLQFFNKKYRILNSEPSGLSQKTTTKANFRPLGLNQDFFGVSNEVVAKY